MIRLIKLFGINKQKMLGFQSLNKAEGTIKNEAVQSH